MPRQKVKRNVKDDECSSPKKKKSEKSKLKPSAGQSKSVPQSKKFQKETLPSSFIGISKYLKEHGWLHHLQNEFQKDYFQRIESTLLNLEEKSIQVYPEKELIFNAFNLTPFDKVKVVILGQDPYHDDDQAHGLAFSVPVGIKVPPSLKNIFKELGNDITGFKMPDHGCLSKWADEGVLLLNAALTVEAHEANSHGKKKFGWQNFTDHVMKTISDNLSGIVYILWGNFAHKKEELIDTKKHCVIKAAHPSPLSFNKFSGCKCFSQANSALCKFGKQEVDWQL